MIQALSNVGYNSAKVKREIEQLSKSEVFSRFFDNLSVHLKRDNAITTQQLEEYGDLVNNQKVLELKAVAEATRYESHQQKLNMQKQQHLQRELQAAKRRYALLEQHLACLDKTHSDALEEEDNLEELTRHSKSALEQSRRLHKSTVAECCDAIANLDQDCEKVYSSYKNKNNTQALISLVDLNKYLARENEYKSELTLYARKLFENVQTSSDDWTSELHSAADTILLEAGDRPAKEELLGDLRRATRGYEGRKKRMILAMAKMEKAVAIDKFLQSKRNSLRFGNPMQDVSYLDSLKYSIETTIDQSSYLMKSVLPSLLAGGAPEVKNLVLTGDFKQKLSKQREVRKKQQSMIDLLLQQCSRLTLIWMMLLLEKTQTEILSRKMEGVSTSMTRNIETISTFLQILNSISSLDYSEKEQKAVIDKRDTTMLNLHNLLVDQESHSSIFKTFESLHEAASKLMSKKNDFRRNTNPNFALCTSLRDLYWNHSSPSDDDCQVLLTSPDVKDGLKRLEDAVAETKISVSKLLTTVDKKRAFLEHNEEARLNMTLWMDFVTLALSAK